MGIEEGGSNEKGRWEVSEVMEGKDKACQNFTILKYLQYMVHIIENVYIYIFF